VCVNCALIRKEYLLGVFEAIGSDTHEEVLYGQDPSSGLKAIIAIHSTALGPALGGTRFYPYETEKAALRDALRLAKGMSYKSAAAGLDLGGGKAVIIGDPRTIKSERLLRAYGRLIDSLGGRYITAEDVGATTQAATARGVIGAMGAVATRLWGSDDLADRTVAVQGVGKVGSSLVERLTKAGAKTVVCDVNEKALERASSEHGSIIVATDEIFDIECDIFAPCAMGGAINEQTVGRLRCQAVAGSANNQLETEAMADRLMSRGILYAPDFIVNAGGIINIADEMHGYDRRRAAAAVDQIHDNLRRVFDKADESGVTPNVAAIEVAKDRIAGIGSIKLRRRGHRP
jgi:leucine dehydrogenase